MKVPRRINPRALHSLALSWTGCWTRHTHRSILFRWVLYRWTAELAEDFNFQIPYHYHCTRDEYMTVTRGYVDFTVAGKTTRLTPEMGEFHIPAGQRHGIHKPKGITSTFRERTSHPQARIEFFKDLFYGGVMVRHINTFFVSSWGVIHPDLISRLSLAKSPSCNVSILQRRRYRPSRWRLDP